MLGEATLLHPDDIRSYQGAGSSVSGKSSVQNDVVALGHDQRILVSQRVRKRFDEVEEAIAARLDMRAVLNITFGPKSRSCRVVPFVEERIERLRNDFFILLR
jgi:hypothetical protein